MSGDTRITMQEALFYIFGKPKTQVTADLGAKPQLRMTSGCSSSTTGDRGPDVDRTPYVLALCAVENPSDQLPPEP